MPVFEKLYDFTHFRYQYSNFMSISGEYLEIRDKIHWRQINKMSNKRAIS